MGLKEALRERQENIVKKWQDKLIESYPEDTQRFLRREKDQFANPVGYIIRNEIRSLYEGFIEQDKNKINSSLTSIIKVRAVQDFTPSGALYFLVSLKDIIRDETDWNSYPLEEREELDNRIILLLLEAFDIYEQCRNRLYDIRVNEIKNHVSGLLRMANLVYEIPDLTK